MKYIRYGWVLLLTALLLALTVTPASAAQRAMHRTVKTQDTTNVNATIYLSNALLQPMFQSRIDAAVPTAVNNAIAGIVNGLPNQDRGWAQQMATTLLQPSATLISLVPEQGGLVATLRLNLYAGDPQPITAKLLVKFGVVSSSTIQVTVQPVSGSPSLVSGPIDTFNIPLGSLSSITATNSCGDAALAINLQFPISLGNTQSGSTGQQSSNMLAAPMQPMQYQRENATQANAVSSYVEIPSSSLSQLGTGIGTLPINSSFSAQNIQVSVQGSNLIVNSDIMWGSFRLGVATTTFQPLAQNGDLALQIVGETQLTWADIFKFPFGTYDPQIQQMINSKLSNALTGKFYVTDAAIGPNSHIPCAASDSLLLTGTTSLV